MNSKKLIFNNILIYSLSHGLVDAVSAGVIFSIFALKLVSASTFFYLVVLYNVLAFGLQAPFGFISDKLKSPKKTALMGIFLMILAIIFLKFSIAAVILAGLGNALFHVGGGIISLNLIPKKATMPGIFVAPGAAGLFIGALLGKSGNFLAWPFLVLLLFSLILIWSIRSPKIDYNTKVKENNYLELIVLLLMLSIVVRSLIGLSLVFPWKANLILGIVFICGVVLGKAFGGILGDKFGWMRVTLIGLLVSAPLLAFGNVYPILGIIGIFLFNLTMPITLIAISNSLPGRAGFAFGLTTIALLFGALPVLFGYGKMFNGVFNIIFIIIISTVCAFIGLKLYYKNNLRSEK